jgi:catechol 2,3-dioxygenase-like lactoylglutathione lyase family enzyme
MTNHITGIDHVLVGVRDLEAAGKTWERLGFVLSPPGRHVGWGTANRCLMLEQGYVELLGVVDPSQLTAGLGEFLETRGEGMVGLALATDDPEATGEAWRRVGLSPEVRELGRQVEDALLRFRNVMLEPEETLGLRLFACHALTPGPMRRKEWLAHPNGALAIASVTILSEAPEELVPALGRLVGSTRITTTDRVVAAHTGHGVILVADPDDVDMLHPEIEALAPAEGPLLAALSIAVEDPERSARVLSDNGVPFRRDRSGAIGIAPADAHGVMLELVSPSAVPELAGRD